MGEAGGATVGELGGVDGTSEPWMIVPPFVPVFATESPPEVSSTEDAERFARNSSAAADCQETPKEIDCRFSLYCTSRIMNRIQ